MQAFGGFLGSRSLHDAADSFSSGLDAEIDMHLRRLSKRDATTKLKALAELRKHVTETTPDSVAALCPPWLQALQRLASDGNRSVRAAAATLCGEVVVHGGRSLVQHVRPLLSLWWPLQFDLETEVATPASNSLAAAFPGHKRLEATAYAAEALCQAASASLRLRTPAELPEPPSSPEDGAERLSRMHTCALRTLAALPTVLSARDAPEKVRSQAAAAAHDVANVVSTEHAWLKSQCRSTTVDVRGAAFAVLASLHRTAADVCVHNMAAIVPLAVNAALCEKSSSALPDALEAALGCLQAGGESAWTMAQPAPEQRIRTLFASAFHGTSAQCARTALPLLSMLPARLAGAAPEPAPLATLLEALWEGRGSIQSADVTARRAMDTAYGECVGFAVLRCRQAAEQTGASKEVADTIQTALLQATLVGSLLAALLQEQQLSAHDIKSLSCQFADVAVMLHSKASLCIAAREAMWDATTQQVALAARSPTFPAVVARIGEILTRIHDRADADWVLPVLVRPLVAQLLCDSASERLSPCVVGTMAWCVRLFGAAACVSTSPEQAFSSDDSRPLEQLLHECLRASADGADAATSNEHAQLVASVVSVAPALWRRALDSRPGLRLVAEVVNCLVKHAADKPQDWLNHFQCAEFDTLVSSAAQALGDDDTLLQAVLSSNQHATMLSPDGAAPLLHALTQHISNRDAGAKTSLAIAPLAMRHVPQGYSANARAGLLASIFQLRLAHVENDDGDDDNDDEAGTLDELLECALVTWLSISDARLLGAMPLAERAALGTALATAVRAAACTSPTWRAHLECANAAHVLADVLKVLCADQPEDVLDAAFDAVCAPLSSWPAHVFPAALEASVDTAGATTNFPADWQMRMAHLIAALCCAPELPSSKLLVPHRAWLAAELLCCEGLPQFLDADVLADTDLLVAVIRALARAMDDAGSQERDSALTRGLDAALQAWTRGPCSASAASAAFQHIVQPAAQQPAHTLGGSQLRTIMATLPPCMSALLASTGGGQVALEQCRQFTLAACTAAIEALRTRSGAGMAAAHAALLLVAACFPVPTALRPARPPPRSDAELRSLCSVWDAIAAADAAAAAGLAAARRFGGATQDERPSLSDLDVGIASVAVPLVACAWKQLLQPHWSFLVARLHRWLDAVPATLLGGAAEHVDVARFTSACTSSQLELPALACHALLCIEHLPLEVSEPVGTSSGDVVPYAVDGLSARTAALALCEVSWPSERTALFSCALTAVFTVGWMRVRSGGDAVRRVFEPAAGRGSDFWRRCAELSRCAPAGAALASAVAVDAYPGNGSAVAALYALLRMRDEMERNALLDALSAGAFALLASPPMRHAAVFGLDASVKDVDTVLRLLDERSEAATDDADNLHPDSGTSSTLAAADTAALRQPLAAMLAGSRSGSAHLLAWALLLSAILDGHRADELRTFVVASEQLPALLDIVLLDLPLPAPKALRQTASLPAHVTDVWRCASQPLPALRTAAVLPPAQLAGALFGGTLHALPSQCRAWFVDVRDSTKAAALEAAVAQFVSPALISSELRAAIAAPAVSGLTVTASDREISAAYAIDDAMLQVSLKFGTSYPLRAPDVDCAKRVGVSEARLRKWLLAMNAALRTGGGVAAALALWGSGCAREFEGVEPCPICYMTVHASSHALPKLSCRQCRNRFHGACLYNWFTTSHKSACPICLTVWGTQVSQRIDS